MEDKEGDKAIVEELLFREANRFAREPFEAGAQGQVLWGDERYRGPTAAAAAVAGLRVEVVKKPADQKEF